MLTVSSPSGSGAAHKLLRHGPGEHGVSAGSFQRPQGGMAPLGFLLGVSLRLKVEFGCVSAWSGMTPPLTDGDLMDKTMSVCLSFSECEGRLCFSEGALCVFRCVRSSWIP